MSHASVLPPLPPRPVPSTDPAGRDGRRTWLVLALVALAVVLLGVAAVRALAGFASGASSPEQAVEDFLEGMAAEDGVASIAALSPGEARGADALQEAVEQRLASLDVDAAALAGEGLVASIEDLDLSSEQLADGVARVTVEGGTFVVEREDGAPIDVAETFGPLGALVGLGAFASIEVESDASGSGSVVVSEGPSRSFDGIDDGYGWYASTPEEDVADSLADEPVELDRLEVPLAALWSYVAMPFSWSGDDLEDGADEGADVDTTFLVVRHDDRWHVSIVGTVADVVARVTEAPAPDFAALATALDAAESGDRAVGATPDDAIRLLVESFGDGQVADVLDALPVDLVGGLYPFASALQDLVDSDGLALDLAVTDLATTQISDANGLVRLRVDRLAAEGTAVEGAHSDDVDLVLDGSCLTVEGEEECLPADFVDATTIDGLVLTLVEVEGGYQVDPLATLYDNLATVAAELPEAWLTQLLGDPTDGERIPVGTGTTAVTFDEAGAALLEVPAEAGDVLSVAVEPGVEVDGLDVYQSADPSFPDYASVVERGLWDEAAEGEPVVTAVTVDESGDQLVHVQLAEQRSAEVAVTVNVGAVPTVALGDPVELQYGAYGVASFTADAVEAAAEDGEVVATGPGTASYCWTDEGPCAGLVVAAGPGVTLDVESYEGGYSDGLEREPDAYDLPRADATLAGAEDGLLVTSLEDGELEVTLDVATEGWVLLDVVNHIEDGDLVVTVLDADGEEVDYADAGLEHDDEWLDLELDPGTYTIVVELYDDAGDPTGDVDLLLS
ncbi:hypothetical protein [Nocardioides zeae]|uniref:Uncharacterized protein n=1 Tax=Nocardioides zeae TaxID=1457234 RepID=A0AAJ1U2C3_9ACTN|nr:hypothetical protein [Nocardioides zeae]MDQ1106295.1 hypothetical protein [Nocardioides zeae]